MNDKQERRAILRISPELLANIGVGTFRVVKTDVPSDVQVVAVRISPEWSPGSPEQASVEMILESPSFDAVADGAPLPCLNGPVFKKVAAPGAEPPLGRNIPAVKGRG